eukprot:1370615-Rhodomonas_salina.2
MAIPNSWTGSAKTDEVGWEAGCGSGAQGERSSGEHGRRAWNVHVAWPAQERAPGAIASHLNKFTLQAPFHSRFGLWASGMWGLLTAGRCGVRTTRRLRLDWGSTGSLARSRARCRPVTRSSTLCVACSPCGPRFGADVQTEKDGDSGRDRDRNRGKDNAEAEAENARENERDRANENKQPKQANEHTRTRTRTHTHTTSGPHLRAGRLWEPFWTLLSAGTGSRTSQLPRS